MNKTLFRNNQFLSWFLLVLLSLIWGSSFILMKKGLLFFKPGQVAGIRILSASLILLPISLKNLPSLRNRNFRFLFISGLVGSFIPAFLFATAQTRIDSAISGVLNALTPIFTILAGASLFRSRFTTRVILGIVIGFIGSVVLITAGSKGVFWQVNFYALLIVLATAFYGLNVNVIKFYLGDLKSSHITSLSMLMMGPLALIYLFTQADLFTPLNESGGALLSFLAIVTLGVMGSAVALILFNILLKITNPVFSSSVTYLMPVVAIMWGVLDGEILNEKHILGIIFTITGVFIANTNKNS